MNIVEQISHLKTFPYIRQRVAENKLMIMGWYYQIETGEVFNYDQERKMFLKIE